MKALDARRLLYAYLADHVRCQGWGVMFGEKVMTAASGDARATRTLEKAIQVVVYKLGGFSKGEQHP